MHDKRSPHRHEGATQALLPRKAYYRLPENANLALLSLQRSAGNAAVVSMFARTLPLNRGTGADVQWITQGRVHHIQRATGLLLAGHVRGVSTRLLELWRSRKSATIEALISGMIDVINAELKILRIFPMGFDPTPSDTEAHFRHQDWRTSINLDIILQRKVGVGDKAGSLSLDDIAKVAESLFHEGRHAEQTFLVARKRAKTQPNPDLLAKSLEIPVTVAKEAKLIGAPAKNDATNEQIEEWAAFLPSGRHFKYFQWNEVMKKLTAESLKAILEKSPETIGEFTVAADQVNDKINVSTKWSFPYERLQELEQLSQPESVDKTVLASLRKITSAFDKLVLSIDDFRQAVILMRPTANPPTPETAKVRQLEAITKWIGIRISQEELYVAQSDAYLDYPHETDARKAGEAVKQGILPAATPARHP